MRAILVKTVLSYIDANTLTYTQQDLERFKREHAIRDIKDVKALFEAAIKAKKNNNIEGLYELPDGDPEYKKNDKDEVEM
jgi:hypothetical protein